MVPSLEETIVLDFITSSSTGAAADADSTPTAAVYEDANDTAILTPTVTKRTSLTGNYRVPVACTAANGFEAGKSYNVIASATIGGVAAKCKVGSFQVRTKDIDDTLSAQLADGVTHGGTTATLRLGSSSSSVPAFYATNSGTLGQAAKFEATGTSGTGFDCLGGARGVRFQSTVQGNGIHAIGFGSGAGMITTGGTTGNGWEINAGSTSGNAINLTLTSGVYLSQSAEDEIAVRVWAAAARTLTSLDEDTTTLDLDATIRAAVGMASANLDTQIGDVPTNAELASALAAALVAALPQSYRALNATGSVAQLLYEIAHHLGNSAIAGTTKTIKKNDGTAAKTFTLDDANSPTSIIPAT